MAAPTAAGRPNVIRIRPARGFAALNLAEMWHYRELVYFLTWRDVKIRYKQTLLGVAWALLQPVAMMLVFSLFFGRLANVPSEGVPYPLFALVALIPWQLFSRAITESSTSLVTDQRLITRVYFPRLIVPTATVLAALVDFFVAFVLLLALMGYYQVVPTATVVFLPLFVLLAVVTALGIGFYLSAMNLEFRDVQYTIPFLNQFLLFLTPVMYPATLVPEKWRLLYALNPMAGVVEGFRWTLLGVPAPSTTLLVLPAVVGVALFVTGMMFFRWRERTFTDTVGSGGR